MSLKEKQAILNPKERTGPQVTDLDSFRKRYGWDGVTFRLVMERMITKAIQADHLLYNIPEERNGVAKEGRAMLEDLRKALMPEVKP